MPEPLRSDQVIKDRYIVRRIIGRGGMGSIYLAEDNRLPGRLCALKEVHQDESLPKEMREQGHEQFYREASVLARLDHPNLPKVSDFFSENECDYLVMDFVPGEDLKLLMDHARREGTFLSQEDVLTWASQLADALEYLHNQPSPVIHRDIKPSNLKLTPSGLVKLVDFGLVKQMAPDEMTVTVIQGRGTALYTPLEQYGGDAGHTDARSDIYAFGATIYHLLTNHPPTEAKQRFLRPDALRLPRDLNNQIDPSVETAILWAMALHPDERPQDIESFRQALFAKDPVPDLIVRGRPSLLQTLLRSTTHRILVATTVIMLLVAVIATFL
ncbi:MAG: serine/threonine protein kinase [Anaerolineaceae bacterium]|nr:MAG: serine/threonine protein kinase [Anaerolineaceae bacterium]